MLDASHQLHLVERVELLLAADADDRDLLEHQLFAARLRSRRKNLAKSATAQPLPDRKVRKSRRRGLGLLVDG